MFMGWEISPQCGGFEVVKPLGGRVFWKVIRFWGLHLFEWTNAVSEGGSGFMIRLVLV